MSDEIPLEIQENIKKVRIKMSDEIPLEIQENIKKVRIKMSDEIPLEIQENIIKKVPIKPLIRFRAVSKQWKSLIDSSEFLIDHIIDHYVNQTHPHRLLVRYKVDSEYKYVSILDDDSFPHYKFSPTVSNDSFPRYKFTSPDCNTFRLPLMLDCSHGLVCLFAPPSVILWNPSIRKYVGIELTYQPYAFGVGVCPKTFDTKLVKITRFSKKRYEAEVYSLRVGAWKSIPLNMPRKPDDFNDTPVVVDGVIYWAAYNKSTYNGEYWYEHRVISFDLTSEEFGEIVFPNDLEGPRDIAISKLNESLVVLEYRESGDYLAYCIVRTMLKKNGVPEFSWTKVVPTLRYSISGFRNNGSPIVRIWNPEREVDELGSYDNNDGLGIFGSEFKMAFYTESLLLLNHTNSQYY